MSEPEPNKDSIRTAEGDFKVRDPFSGLRQADGFVVVASTPPQRLRGKQLGNRQRTQL